MNGNLSRIPMTQDPFKQGLAAARRGDFATAARLWETLAVQGDRRAQYNLGYLHANGQGLPQDYGQALDWYRRLPDQGFAPAQFNLGVLLSGTDGVPTDYPTALQWYRKAAGQGDADAQFNIGVAFATGQGVATDYVQAFRWYSRAAAAGHAQAAKTRDSIAAEMTPGQLAEAQGYAKWICASRFERESALASASSIETLPSL